MSDATDTKDTPPGDSPDDKKDDGGDKKPTNSRVTLADVRKEINEALDSALSPIKEALLGKEENGDPKDSPDQKDADEAESDTKRQPGFRQIERMVTKATEAAVAKITHEADHQALHTKKEVTKEPETPPIKKRWSTKLMGWD
jgi:hypothetical protein